MANTVQAKKRIRQAEDKRKRNMSQRSAMRTGVKKVRAAINGGDKDEASAAYQVAASRLDKMARKGIIHKNVAARSKSRLNKAVRALP